jgi:hypothetical protein
MGERGRRVGQPRHNGYKATGTIDKRRPEYRQIAISFDKEQFEEIATRAASANISFSELVKIYCEWGLETDSDEKFANVQFKGRAQ